VIGGIGVGSLRSRDWPPETLARLRVVGELFANALARRRGARKLRIALDEVMRLQERAQREYAGLQHVRETRGSPELVAESRAMREVLAQARQVAGSDTSVLVVGETGTGKERLARMIHAQSARRDRPLVHASCAALPPGRLEAELFGRERGAYTEALTGQAGRLELADGGTLLLDEVAVLPLELQAKLLQVLESGRFERAGSPGSIAIDVRVIATTSRDLERATADGRFREDLFYRLNVFPIVIPPLRERSEDVPSLVRAFIRALSDGMGRRFDEVPARALELLQRHAWPGNVRELRNVVERAMIQSPGRTLLLESFEPITPGASLDRRLDSVQRRHILGVLESTGWRIRGRSGAAEILGLKPTTLEARMARLDIARPRQADGGRSR
jgi:transcriptional regulator with GAF, ATPase, and Fis domain